MRLLLLTLCIGLASAGLEWDSLEGFQVLKIHPQFEQQKELLRKLEEDVELDFWDAISKQPGSSVQVMIPAWRVREIKAILENNDVAYSVFTENVQEVVDAEHRRLAEKRDYDSDDFNTFEEIMDKLDSLAANCPAESSCEVNNLGQSYEGRDLKVLRISSGSGRPAIWIDSLIHAREWLCGTTVMRIAEKLIDEYGQDNDATYLLDNYDFYFLPVMNPDGYVYTWESSANRYWRKSRSVNEGNTCMGTDLNRNYNVNWGNAGTSTNPCSDTYGGSAAGSEPETQIVQNEAVRLNGDVVSWLTWHSKATMILHPYGHTSEGSCVYALDHDKMNEAGEAFAEAIRDYDPSDGEAWPYGNSCETIYPASGGTSDYAYDYGGAIYSYTPETRGDDWVISPTEIEPSFQESWYGILALVEKMEEIAARQ